MYMFLKILLSFEVYPNKRKSLKRKWLDCFSVLQGDNLSTSIATCAHHINSLFLM